MELENQAFRRQTTEDSAADIETGTEFRPRFSADGLVVAVVTDAGDGRLLMVAHMNAQALDLSLKTGIAHYWSRSRDALWRKGESSGHEQRISEIRIDCDQDVVQLSVTTGATGANCHTGRRSCFYRTVTLGEDGRAKLTFDADDQPRFDPEDVYGH